jgi:secretion/DNA translocation related CpaE-like protein
MAWRCGIFEGECKVTGAEGLAHRGAGEVSRRRDASTALQADRPLVLTGDMALLDDVLRLAAAAGVDAEVVPDPAAARGLWLDSPLVVIGEDAVAGVEHAALPRRPGLVIVSTQPADDALLRTGLALGASAVLSLPAEETTLVAHFTDTAESGGRGGSVVCIVGGRGGAGASTMAAALALTAARRRMRVVLVDADPLGGGIELALGGEAERGLRWSELRSIRGRTSGIALRAALPTCLGMEFVSWDGAAADGVTPAAMTSLVQAAARVSDLLVADISRHVDEVASEVLVRAAATFLVVPAEVRAAAAGRRVLTKVSPLAGNIRAVVRVPGPSGLDADAVAESLGLPLFGELRPERGLSLALEHGLAPARSGRGPLARLCGRILDELAVAGAVVQPPAARANTPTVAAVSRRLGMAPVLPPLERPAGRAAAGDDAITPIRSAGGGWTP